MQGIFWGNVLRQTCEGLGEAGKGWGEERRGENLGDDSAWRILAINGTTELGAKEQGYTCCTMLSLAKVAPWVAMALSWTFLNNCQG